MTCNILYYVRYNIDDMYENYDDYSEYYESGEGEDETKCTSGTCCTTRL